MSGGSHAWVFTTYLIFWFIILKFVFGFGLVLALLRAYMITIVLSLLTVRVANYIFRRKCITKRGSSERHTK